MLCGRLHLQERARRAQSVVAPSGRPRRYCQKLMVDPGHDESDAWTQAIMERYYQSQPPTSDEENIKPAKQHQTNHSSYDDLFLTVQTLKFQGEIQEQYRPRTSFKYKAPDKETKHRLFVKEVVIVDNNSEELEELPSQVTRSQIDHYLDYSNILDRSRPSTADSNPSDKRRNSKENKAVQVELYKPVQADKNIKIENKFHNNKRNNVKYKENTKQAEKKEEDGNIIQDTKIAFHKSGKRKSLTISRAPSPETVQVIRVDVVCNYSSTASIISENEESKPANTEITNKKPLVLQDMKNSRFAQKYLLTKTIKSLDANVSGGAKVTLLCKTFRLANRSERI